MAAGGSGAAGRQLSPLAGWGIIALGLTAALFVIAEPVRDAVGARITAESVAAANVAFYAVLFVPLIVLSLVLGAIERRRVLRAGERPLRWAAVGLLIGVGGLATCVAYAWLNGGLRLVPLDPAAERHIVLALLIVLLGVTAEELLFRGWLQSALQDRLGPWLAVVLSAVAFSGFHLWAGGAADPVSLANLLLGGLWFGLLALRSGGVIAPMAAHFGWNAAESLGFGLDPNPGVDELGALANYEIIGAPLWGGSEEGLNASIGMTIVLIALLLPLLPMFAGRSRAAA
jgi:uncharacterized protein